jgi:4-hydroxy-4-methyl-2-oxoglutarate aldolase
MYGHIYYRIARPEPDLLAAFSVIPTSTLSDAMGRHGALSWAIHPIYQNIRMVGTALTVLCFPGDNLMTHKALQMVQPGDVLVIDDGDSNSGCFGHRSALAARGRGGTGVVVSGSIRDVAALRQERFPVFARGVSPRAPQKNTPGSINVPVHVGGIVISPGDIVVGDDDGVVVIPLAMASAVLEKARFRDRKERESATITAGELPIDPSGAALSLDKLLDGRVVEHHELRLWGAERDATKP